MMVEPIREQAEPVVCCPLDGDVMVRVPGWWCWHCLCGIAIWSPDEHVHIKRKPRPPQSSPARRAEDAAWRAFRAEREARIELEEMEAVDLSVEQLP